MHHTEREWTKITSYYASQHDRKHGELTHAWYSMTDEDERVVCIHKPDNSGPFAGQVHWCIQHLDRFEGWIYLSPLNVHIHSEEQAFAVAEWRRKRRADAAFNEPAPWLAWKP